MQKRFVCSIILLMAFVAGYAQQLAHYEYWIDDDYASRTSESTSQEDVSALIDVSSLAAGVHFFNFRSTNSNGEKCSPYRYLFYLPEVNKSDAAIASYEYWIDDNYANKASGAASSDNTFAVDVSALSSGVHFYNFRVRNSAGEYSQAYRYLFYVPEYNDPDATLGTYEYWLDDDFANKKSGVASSVNTFAVDVSALSSGVHFYNFRVLNSSGEYSQAYRYLFYVPDDYASASRSDIVGYSYSFNNKSEFVGIDNASTFELSNITFEVPEVREFANIGSNCTFTFSQEMVEMSRSTDVCFMLRFLNEGGAWGTPEIYSFTENDKISKATVELPIQKSILLGKVPSGDYQAVRFSLPTSGKYYLRSTQLCNMDIYDESGKLVTSVSPSSLNNTYAAQMLAGNYYGIIYNTVTDAENEDKQVGIRLMTTNNYVPTPEIVFANDTVTISCSQEDAVIYYTLDGANPTEESLRYTGPFVLDHNAVVKSIAKADDYADSFVGTLKIDSYNTANPVIEFANLNIYISCETEKSSVYYTLDGSDPVTYGVLYTKPVAISNSCTVKAVAKRDGYNNSEVITYELDITNVKCIKPVLAIEGNLLAMTTLSEGATIYYTTNGSTPTLQSERYVSPILLSHNATYKAIAMKSGEIQSDMAEFVVDWFQAELPEMTFVDGKLTITSSTPASIIYYALGGEEPTTSSSRYTSPIALTDNRVVKAFAVADGFNASEVVTYTPNMFTCDTPEISFDGHAITISCNTPGAEVYYTTNGANPTEQSNKYSGTTILDGLCTIKVVAIKNEMNNSKVVTYVLPCYYNGGDAYVNTEGTMEHAFSWCGIPNVAELSVNGSLNSEDFATIRKMTSLEHLNLSGATVSSVSDEALAGMNLITVSLPSSQFTCGSRILKGCKRLAAIEWNSLSKIPDDILDGMSLPNMLLYVRNAASASTMFNNVIVGNVADKIELSDAVGSNFYCPHEFTARSISYSHSYLQKTVSGVCTGWETIALPFAPTSISHATQGNMAPFAANDTHKKPFWLCALTETGFVSADKIEANTPYIIAMPNSDMYSDEYILAGEVTFSGNNVQVCNSSSLKHSSKGDNIFTPNFVNRAKETCMTLNVGEEYSGHMPGSLFAHNYRDAKPFEAYIYATYAMAARRVFYIEDEVTGLEKIATENDIQIALVGKTIEINGLQQSGIAELYDITGQKLATVTGNGGKATIDCSAYKNQTLIIRANSNKEIKTFKFNL